MRYINALPIHMISPRQGGDCRCCAICAVWHRFPILGTGLGTHEMVFPMFDTSTESTAPAYVEVELAQVMEEMGIAGIALGGGICRKHCCRLCKRCAPPSSRAHRRLRTCVWTVRGVPPQLYRFWTTCAGECRSVSSCLWADAQPFAIPANLAVSTQCIFTFTLKTYFRVTGDKNARSLRRCIRFDRITLPLHSRCVSRLARGQSLGSAPDLGSAPGLE